MSAYEDNYNGTAIHLIDGSTFDFEKPEELELDLHTVGHALARENRYGGHHGAENYSVAEHATIVAWLVANHYKEPRYAMAALHHDDSEVVLKDLPTPYKNWLKKLGVPLKPLENAVMVAVSKAFNIPMDDFHAGVIHDADVLAYAAEISLLKPNGHGAMPEVDEELLEKVTHLIQGLPAPAAEQSYMMYHKFLAGELKIETKTITFGPSGETPDVDDGMPEDPFNGPQLTEPEIDWDKDDPADPR